MKALKKTVLKNTKLGKLALGPTLGAALVAAVAMNAPAFADSANDYRQSGHDLGRIVYNEGYNSRNSNRSNNSRFNDGYHQSPITVRLRFDANGSGRVPLQRLLRTQHGIDSSKWRIRSVNVRHKSRRFATAALRVGDRSSGRVSLRRGITTIHAPRTNARLNARGYDRNGWVLGFNNAKLRDVAVVLEPVAHNRQRNDNRRRNGSRDLAFNARFR